MEPSTERTESVPACYSTLDAVQVPAGVPAGGCFLVSVAATRRGKDVSVPKPLWRASGCMPAVQARAAVTVPGARHQHRPAARAGRGLRAVDTLRSGAVHAGG